MRLRILLPVAGLLLTSTLAQAHTEIYTAVLDGPSEFPANASPGTGWAKVTLDLDLLTMRVEASFSGLTGNVSAAHIHGPTPPVGNPVAGVMTTTPSFPSFPTGGTSGSYDMMFDLTTGSTYGNGFLNTTHGGNVGNAMNAFISSLDAGTAYFNIHTSTFAGGEIRGFLVEVAPIPEPSTYALFGGLVALGGAVWLRRRRAA